MSAAPNIQFPTPLVPSHRPVKARALGLAGVRDLAEVEALMIALARGSRDDVSLA